MSELLNECPLCGGLNTLEVIMDLSVTATAIIRDGKCSIDVDEMMIHESKNHAISCRSCHWEVSDAGFSLPGADDTQASLAADKLIDYGIEDFLDEIEIR